MEYGCFRSPDNCENESCKYLAKWKKVDNDKIEFSLSTQLSINSWLAIGFSNDMKMVLILLEERLCLIFA
jgi:hypothetical protein